MDKYICLTCEKGFSAYKRRGGKIPKYCSRKCFSKRPISEETRKRQSDAKIGKVTWNKGIHMWETREHPRGTLGMKLNRKAITPETKRKLSESHMGLKYPHSSKEKHWNWKGGATNANEAVRKSAEYKGWRRHVFERDNFTCVVCGKRGGELHADHIIPFSENKEKRFDISNGRTLCVNCHRKTETYGVRVNKHGK